MYSRWVSFEIHPAARVEFLKKATAVARAAVWNDEDCFRFDVIELGGPASNRFAFYQAYRAGSGIEDDKRRGEHGFPFPAELSLLLVVDSQNSEQGEILSTSRSWSTSWYSK